MASASASFAQDVGGQSAEGNAVASIPCRDEHARAFRHLANDRQTVIRFTESADPCTINRQLDATQALESILQFSDLLRQERITRLRIPKWHISTADKHAT